MARQLAADQPNDPGRTDQIVRIEGALTTINRIINGRSAYKLRVERSGVVLPKPHVMMLRTLYERGPMRVVDLGTINNMDKGYASRTWRTLESEGYVETVPGDPRAVTVALTPAGRDLYQRWLHVNTEMVSDTLDGWAAEDLDVLTDVLERLVGSLRDLGVKG